MKLFLITLFLFIYSINSWAMSNLFPGPDGVRFSREQINKIEKRIQDQISIGQLALAEKSELIDLQNILVVGKRAVQWFEKINSIRSKDTKLDLTQKGTSKGIPLEAPMKTNTKILVERFEKLITETPPLVSNILTGSEELPYTVPVSDEEFIKIIRSFDVIYQHTIRWSNAKEYLSWYINRSLWDIRGYRFLKSTPDIEKKLQNWSSLTALEKSNFSSWLFALCHNGDFDDSDCQEDLKKAISKGRQLSFYQRFQKYGEAMEKSFFNIPATRPEAYWSEDETTLFSPFLTPTRIDVKNWLTENIQEEWKGIGFNLILDFRPTSSKTIPHIEFQSGVTAHVNEIAGDTITMDGDYSIGSYAQRWTIRHEYGHILGFVDCYLEFYDVNEQAMIYYEIDIDNLMCSRHGNLKEEHITKLRSAYE